MKMRNGIVGLVLALAATVTVTGSGLASPAGEPTPVPAGTEGQSGTTPFPAGAAMSPASLSTAVHWGTFYLDTPYWNALAYIDPRLEQDPAFGSYRVYDHGNDGDYTIQASQNALDVRLTVVCVPTGPHQTWVSVIATSPNSSFAEQERNLVRGAIINLHLN